MFRCCCLGVCAGLRAEVRDLQTLGSVLFPRSAGFSKVTVKEKPDKTRPEALTVLPSGLPYTARSCYPESGSLATQASAV